MTMLQSIETKYFGASNAKPSRMVARASGGARLVVSYDHELDAAGNHVAAARALAEKLGWNGNFVGGGTQHGFCFVNTKAIGDGFEADSFRTFERGAKALAADILDCAISEGDSYNRWCDLARARTADSFWATEARTYIARLFRERRYDGPSGVEVQLAFAFALRDHFEAHVKEA